MPNYCWNTLHIKGNKESLENILEDITCVDDEGKRVLDFERIINPPYNVFQADVNDFIIRSLNAYINIHDIRDKKEIERIINDPHWFDEADTFSFIDMTKSDFVDQYKEVNYKPEIEIVSWHEWNTKNWGTKWNALEPLEISSNNNGLSISFQTAWSPPVNIYYELIRKYEGNESFGDVEIEYYYYDPQGGFTGNRYEEYDSTDANLYASKVLEYGFEVETEWTGIIYDKKFQKYRFMTDEEQKYFDNNLTLEGFDVPNEKQ